MVKSDSELKKIANNVGLTLNDVNTIQNAKKRKKISKNSFLLVESIIGVSSFLIGYAIVPDRIIEVIPNYPFGSVFLFGNSIIFSKLVTIKSLLRLVAITLLVFIFGFFIGYTTGHFFNITYIPYQGSPVRYGVYSNE